MPKLRDRNEEFACAVCGHRNPLHPTSCRNHCRQCLASQHVDAELPGDRCSTCRGTMPAVRLEYDHREEILVHRCSVCKKEQRNKVAPDDDRSSLEKLASSA